jgi:hypothetical protein
MGAWGSGSFENDDAADWLAELGSIVPDDLTQILVHAAENPGYIEAPASRIVVAAAEIIAALNGSPPKKCPQKLSNGRPIDRRPLQNSRLWHFELWNVCGKTLN